VLLPFGIAFVLAYILNPIASWFQKKTGNRAVAVAATFLLFLLGVAGVLAPNYLIVYVVPRPWYKVTIALALLGALGWVLLLRPHIIRPLPPISKWTPFTFHAFFLLAGIVSGVIFQPPVLLVVSLIMFEIAWLLHRRSVSVLPNIRG
jgi:hypothetical protein